MPRERINIGSLFRPHLTKKSGVAVLRITQIYNYLAPPTTGGHRYERQMAEALGSMEDVRFRRVALHKRLAWLRRYVMPIENLRALPMLKGEDLVIFNSSQYHYMLPLMAMLKPLLKGRMAVTHHHFEGLTARGATGRFRAHLEHKMLSMADIIIAPSKYVEDECRRRWPEKRIFYWPIPFVSLPEEANGSRKCLPEDLEQEGDAISKEGLLRIVSVGSIEPRKGYERLLQAMAMLRERNIRVHLEIAGRERSEAYAEALHRYASANHLDVTFRGYVSDEEKRAFYSSGDIYAMSSVAEGFGIVMAEAMGEGLPVVAFDNSGIPYTVKHEVNGLLVSEGDLAGYADAITRLVEDPSLRRRLGEGARATRAALPTYDDFRQSIQASLKDLECRSDRSSDSLD